MTQRLKMVLKSEPGSLQRVLIVMTKRGYEPAAVTARRNSHGIDAEFELDDPRPVGQLVKALERLFDVEKVEVVS
jgi:acetolactate synthase regulatory subunit